MTVPRKILSDILGCHSRIQYVPKCYIHHCSPPARADTQYLKKYIEPSKKLKYNPRTDIELGNHPEGLLYNLADDPGETTNLANAKPARVKAMQAKLASIRKVGQTSPKSNQ